MINQPVRNGQILNSLAQAIASIQADAKYLPALLNKTIEGEIYQDFVVEMIGTKASYKTLEEWLQAPVPFGCGLKPGEFTRLLQMVNILEARP